MSRYQPGAVARAGTALSFGLVGVALFHVATSAQDRLKTMPGYAQYQKVSTQLNGAVRSGAVSGTWSADSASVEYVLDGKRYRFDVATRSATELGAATGRWRPRRARWWTRWHGHRTRPAGRHGRRPRRQGKRSIAIAICG